ncbi:futalosine hydrolase [Deinococcus irradiatisoli]|uniref:Futalosine hydrolase n=1 Tax=Deinococcus irradiatisoli TaxID=2202254 RepID=A0A2Z3JA05_9DEIO|nr:futalosine hydrolase [Deinococcus irradiatisoli]AWN21832.1 futalosine hydrolase [Deinococcus irradiatisoli]
MKRALIVVATAAEAARLDQLGGGMQPTVVVSGVGAVAAALATQAALGGARFDLAISAGIGGAFPGSGLEVGEVAVASEIVQADLGAWDGPQFLPLDALSLEVAPGNAGRFAGWPLAPSLGLPCGPFVTVSSVTGSAEGAAELRRRVPGALIEGMEGAGVAHAALLAGVPVTEVRGVSNPVGPRDRAAWRIGEALAALDVGLRRVLDALAQSEGRG